MTTQNSQEKPTVTQGLINLEKSPKYQALPTDKKLEVRGHLYDKYIAPYLKAKGVDSSDPSTKEAWVKAGLGTPVKDLKRPGAPTTMEKIEDARTHFKASLSKGGTQTGRMLLNTHQLMMHGLVKTFPIRSFTPIEAKLLRKYDHYVNLGREWLDDREDIANSMLGNNYNSNSPFVTKMVELPGRAAGFLEKQAPFIATVEGVGLAGGLLKTEALAESLLGKSAMTTYAYRALKGAAEGYLGMKASGESDRAAKSMAAFGAKFEIGLAALPYLGKLLGIGGPKALKSSVDAVVNSTPEAIEKADTKTIRGTVVKATAKALNEVAEHLGFKNFWDAQNKGQAGKVVEGLMALGGQANKEFAVHNPDLVKVQAEHDLTELAKNPLGGKFLQVLQSNGAKPVEDIVEHVTQATKAVSGMPMEKSTVGAAAAKSLEFSDNLTKRIQSNIPFEKRTHKFLAALTTLFDEAKSKGGKMSKSDNELFNAIQNQLDQDPEFRSKTLQERLQAGENIHRHIDAIIKEGKVGADGKKRFWRSTVVTPGEVHTPFQRQLEAKTGQLASEHKVGDHVRIGNTSMLGKVVEAYEKHVVVELPSGAKYTVGNNEVFSAGAKRVEIAEEFARRREQANKIQDMKKAELKLDIRQQKKAALEEKKQFAEGVKKVAETVKAEDPKAYISKDHLYKIAQELMYNRNLKGAEFDAARKQMIHDYFSLVKAGATKEDALNAVRENKIDELYNSLLKKKVAERSSGDTYKLEDAIKELFPGKDFPDLTKEQQSQAIQLSMKKGKR